MFRLLILSGGIVAAAGRTDAQSQSEAEYPAPINANSRALPRPAPPEAKETVAAPAEPTRVPRHKTWKELARTHNDEKSRETPGATFSPWTAVGALAVVICLILILARVFRRHAPLFSRTLPTEALEVLGRRFLDQRQSIVLLRIGSRILVVGASAAGLQGIGELSDPVEVDLIAGMCRTTKNGQGLGTSFLSLLKGEASSQTKSRPRSGPPRRREPQVTNSGIPDELPPARMSDPEQELMRRLRGTSAAGARHSEGAEMFRE